MQQQSPVQHLCLSGDMLPKPTECGGLITELVELAELNVSCRVAVLSTNDFYFYHLIHFGSSGTSKLCELGSC